MGEKNTKYNSHIADPFKARNLDAEFFRQSPNGSITVLSTVNQVLCDSLTMIWYLAKIGMPLGHKRVDQSKVQEYLEKIDSWDLKLLTLNHCPSDHAIHFSSKFKRQVVITHLVENPDLAEKYHNKLQTMHAREEMLKDQEALASNMNELIRLLNEAEKQLTNTQFLAGAEFFVADCAFIPVLARIEVLKLEKEFFQKHPRLIYYFEQMKERPSYQIVIGQYSTFFGKMKILLPSIYNMSIRRLLHNY
eukprot:PITA_18603